MRTDKLIETLSEDRAGPGLPLSARVLVAVALGGMASVVLLLATIGLRPDLGAAMIGTWRLPLKLAIAAVLASTATIAVWRSAQPVRSARGELLLPLLAPALLAVAIAAELVLVPSSRWLPNLLGSNAGMCLIAIPLLALAPLAAIIAAMRRGAPASPVLAGSLAGFAAAGVAAAVYALRCPDDSPLFVAVWYGAASLIMASIGRVAGSRLLRW